MVERAKKYDMDALALTDAGNLYGAIEFYKTCRKNDIKPILGVDFYVALRTRHDKQAGIDNRWHRLVLLAKDNTGYKNLIKLVTASHIEGFYYKPRVDHELLEKYSEGLLAIIPSFSGETTDKIKVGEDNSAREIVDKYRNYYGDDAVFLEVTHHAEIDGHEETMKKVISFARSNEIPIVAAHDTYYLDPEDKAARDTLMSVSPTGAYRTNPDENFSFISTGDVNKLFKDEPDALSNTRNIAEMCNLEIELGTLHFPMPEIKEDTTYEDELERLVYLGLKRRGLEETTEIKKQIEYELDVITSKGYAPYFIVVADLLRYAHQHNIPTTIRGSVAGSIVTYLAGITNLNPLEYGLMFERFLNPERPSPPDIDMDFADNRRDEMIQYAREKYGEKHVAQIGTFGTMMARGAVRDITRAMGFPYAKGDQIARLIPFGSQGFPMTIDRAMEESKELTELYKKDQETKEILDMAKKVEGCARHISVHAAGVVISPTPLTDYVPLQHDPRGGKLITQYDMHAVEDVGLVKFDFLGLKNLAILANSVRLIKKWRDEEIDIEKIPLDDENTFHLLSRGETMGLFQLNGSGMTHFLKQLKPTTIHDINAMVALYRPGPMEFIPEYIKRKHDPKLVDYPHESMKEVLEKSFGLLIYQEDVMLTAIKLAGYSWLEADQFRKAMGKKIPKVMAEQEERFKEGCIENGIDQKLVDDLWERIKPFAAYAFNKAHAASYGRVAYQTAYLKANYPVEYMAAVLTADQGNVEKVAEAVAECKRMDIEILPPSVNASFEDFTIVEEAGIEKIRFGLTTIKNFGEGIAETIIEERKQHGKFKSLADFFERVIDRNLNKKSVEALIMSGAMDEFGERGQLLENVDGLLAYGKEHGSVKQNQDSLFSNMSDSTTVPTMTLHDALPVSTERRLAWEKELLGLYISGHPLDKFKDKLTARKYTISSIKRDLKEGMITAAAGIVEDVRPILTKRGEKMAFIRLADFDDTVEVVVFPKVYSEYEKKIETDRCIAVKGRISNRNDAISLIAEAVKEL